MTIEEVKHGDLQFAVKDINEVFGLKQNKIAGRQVLIDFIVGTIGACIGPDPENPGETIWTDPRAGQLKNETMATYDVLTAQTPTASPEPTPEVKEEPLPETQATGEAGDAPKECPDFGKAYDPKDKACAEQCVRPVECQAAMAEVTKGKKKTAAKTKETKPPVTDKYSRAHAFCDALKSGNLSKEGLIKKTNELYMAKGNADNIKESTWAVSTFMKPLLILGVVKEENGVFSFQQ